MEALHSEFQLELPLDGFSEALLPQDDILVIARSGPRGDFREEFGVQGCGCASVYVRGECAFRGALPIARLH